MMKMGEAKRRENQRQYLFKPQPDITAFELALLLPMIYGEDIETTVFNSPQYQHLNILRHFILLNPLKALEN
jgi:hypothetical protein